MPGFSSNSDPSTSEAFVARVSLPLALQMTLLDRYRESIAWIAREFLGREDGQLFPELVSQSANPRQGETVLTQARAKEISLFIAEHAPDLYKPITEAVAEGLRSDDDRIRKSAVLLAGAVEAI